MLVATLSIHDGDHQTFGEDWRRTHSAVISRGPLSLIHQIAVVESPKRISFADRQAIVASSSGIARVLPFLDRVAEYMTDETFESLRAELRTVIEKSTFSESLALEMVFDEDTEHERYEKFDAMVDGLPALRERVISVLAGGERPWLASVASNWMDLDLWSWSVGVLDSSSELDVMLRDVEARVATKHAFLLRLAPELNRQQQRAVESVAPELLPEIEAHVDARVAVCVLAMSNALECTAKLDGGMLRIDLGKSPSAPVLRYVVKKALGQASSTFVQHARGKA